jgi:Zn-dependent protease
MEELSTIQKIVVMALPLVFAIVIHEVAHGWVADKLGDPTARNAGRLTLNPISHIDLFGTIIMPLFLIIFNYPVFGYAKPVPINPYYFRNPKRGMALSSLAGPAVNMLMALFFAFILRVVLPILDGNVPEAALSWFATPIAYMCLYGVIINVVLAVLNLIPIPPLDGSRIVFWLLPEKQGMVYYRLERYGLIIILALFYFGILGKIIIPIIGPIITFLVGEKIF